MARVFEDEEVILKQFTPPVCVSCKVDAKVMSDGDPYEPNYRVVCPSCGASESID